MQADNKDDTPLSPPAPIAKQEEDIEDAPLSPPTTQLADDIPDTPLSPPITKYADDKDDSPAGPSKTKHVRFSGDDDNTAQILKLKKIETNWFECCTQLKKLSEEVIKFKADLDKLHIVHKIEAILGDKSEKEENEKPRVPFEEAKSVYERKKKQVYAQATKRLAQQQIDFEKHKNSLIKNQHPFEQFHGILQAKVKFMEGVTPEMFCNCGEVQRSRLLEKILLSAEQCYLEKKCGELNDEAIRNNNMLRITYGFPEEAKQDDIDEIEKRFTNYKRLCDRLEYSLY